MIYLEMMITDILFFFRKQIVGAGETIQSYNHQAQNRKDESSEMYYQPCNDEDNIDVVNDDDKDSGKHFCHHAVLEKFKSEKKVCNSTALISPVKCKAVAFGSLTISRTTVSPIIRIHFNVEQVLISGF